MSKTTIPTGGLADAAVTTAKITDANITTAKIADDAVTAAKSTGLGITQFHNWRYNTAVQADASPILSNWEENDSNGYERIGSALTYSGSTGYFTLPETGKYLVTFQGQTYHDADTGAVNFFIKGTTDNGSSSHA